jgi:transcription elongation GreA/GreB family factor
MAELHDRRQELYHIEGRILEIEKRLRPLTPREKDSLQAELWRLRARRRRLSAEIKVHEQPPLLEDG